MKTSKVTKSFVVYDINKIRFTDVNFQRDEKEIKFSEKKIEKSYLIFINPNIPFLKKQSFDKQLKLHNYMND